MRKHRSTLRNVSFGKFKGYEDLPDDVVLLFESMIDHPEKTIEHTEEIINNALEGRIDTTKKFNIDAYEYRIKNNTNMNLEKSKFKNVYIEFDNSDDESSRVGGMSADKVSASAIKDLSDAFEEISEDSELMYAVDTIKALNVDFMEDYGMDLIGVIKSAVQGFPQAVSKLTEICGDFEVVSDLVRVILGSGKDIEFCFA